MGNKKHIFTRFFVYFLIFFLFYSFLFVVFQKNTVKKQGKMTPPGVSKKTGLPTSATVLSYTVRRRDTLWSIAEKIYGDGFRWKELAEANDIRDRTQLKIGTKLKLPSSASDVQGVASKKRRIKATPTPTPSPTPMPSPTPTTGQAPATGTSYPSQILNLTNWKLTLPIGPSENPTEIKQPELATYKIDPWFVVSQDGEVRFRAPVNGVTTSGSNYPRSELREMTNNGQEKASWSSNSGTHTMFLDQAVTAVPEKKKHVVAGQIHDAKDDVIVIRLEYPNLYVNVDGKNVHKLDSSYALGRRFTIQFQVSGDQTKVYYEGSVDPVYTLNKSYSGAYFKAGAYPQSNCSKEGSSSLCNEQNYGEVIVYRALVTHQ